MHINLLEKLDDPELKKIREIESNSEGKVQLINLLKFIVYKSLFHKESKVEGDLFHRNVRHGLR